MEKDGFDVKHEHLKDTVRLRNKTINSSYL